MSLAVVALLPAMGWAQTPEQKREGFFFCTVTDLGAMPPITWASPVFASAYGSNDYRAALRSNEMASEFLLRVNALGGAGNKSCFNSADRAEIEAMRAQQRESASKRFMLMKIGDWRDVDWTPAPWSPATAAAVPTQQTRWFYCSATQFYSPGCSGRSCSVSSQVFAMPSATKDYAAQRAQIQSYTAAFNQVALARGVSGVGGATCQDFDTRAEADKSSRDNRNLLDGFNQKFIEVAWVPSALPATQAAVTTPAPTAPPAPTPTPARPAVVAPAASATTLAAQSAAAVEDPALFCFARIDREKPALTLRTPIRKEATPRKSYAEMSTSLGELLAAVKRTIPDDWYDLSNVKCQDNSGIFKGESYCYATDFKRFGGGIQIMYSFCNPSRELLEAREADVKKKPGAAADQIFPWPEKP